MSEYTIETRRRSRSKTPFLRSSCDHENCDHVGDEPHTHHHKKKVMSLAPNVKTIVEETVEVTSSSSVVGSGKNSPSKMSQTKIRTSDYSSEDSPENKNKIATSSKLDKQQQQHQQTTETRTSSTTVISKSTKVRGGSVATSTPKLNNYISSFAAQFVSRGEAGSTSASSNINEVQYQQRRQKEHTQNLINSEKEINNSKNKSFSSFLSNSFGNKSASYENSDHIAYMEYKKAGEYWKTTPKTDYTYSELSPHRRELAPGIVAMPNMSRQSLDNHHERISFMIQRNPAQEEHIRRRYESPKYYQNRKAAERFAYDSGDEVDYSQYQSYGPNRYNYNNHKNESWLMRLITTIVTTITTTWSSITGSNNANTGAYYNSSMYYTKLTNEERGFFGSIVYGISSAFLSIVRNIYLFISSVLYLDTWLLQSSSADSKGKKRFFLLLLILLPLLLLAGFYYYLYPNETFPPKHFSQYTSTLTIPEIPKIDFSEYVNEEKYNELKGQALNRLDDLRDWSNDYFLYLKTVTQNLVDEGRKVFKKEEYYERI